VRESSRARSLRELRKNSAHLRYRGAEQKQRINGTFSLRKCVSSSGIEDFRAKILFFTSRSRGGPNEGDDLGQQ
jgi:hypothetical protein